MSIDYRPTGYGAVDKPGSFTPLIAAVLLLLGGSLSSTAVAQEGDAEYSRKGADTCLSCHEDDLTLAVFRTRHAIPSDADGPFGHGQLQCEACHGPGDAHSGRVRRGQERPPSISFRRDDPTPIEVQNGMCLECHSEDTGFGWHAGAHPVDEVSCASCHTSHAAEDPVLFAATQPEVCIDCHTETRTEIRKAFAHPLAEGKMGCTDCHNAHGDEAATGFAALTPLDTCQTCHAETRGPHLWEHAPATEDCGLCHAPHGSNHPGMLTRRAPLLCQSCHTQDGHPSVAFDSGDLVSGVASQYLLGQSCLNCHSQVHGSNHPSGSALMR